MSLQARLSDLPLFRAPEPELEARDEVLDHLEALRLQYVQKIRARLIQVYFERRHTAIREGYDPDRVYVTSTEARTIFEALPHVPPPEELNRNFLGTVFRADGWEECGVEPSRTPGRRGALIRRWRYAGNPNTLGPGERGSERPRTSTPPAGGTPSGPGPFP